ncbi:glycoside hydrolase family 44 protein [Desulfamplus magnetovallimortis]|uniref:glycoside hydrolase family 44 protein n=1 Tax=Desulfamplus magnetovallimortis TaxID=1246637 RepID=UPI00164833C1|nr:glycoside hydrolase family 44 protein [Desulfamplus magnetovallimortis]
MLFYVMLLSIISLKHPLQLTPFDIFISTSPSEAAADDLVTLVIDPSSERKSISPYIYGINIANWAPSYYMYMVEDHLREAQVEVVRLGATNMERYNFINNRMYNVISKQNQYVPMSWESFVDWVVNDLDAEPFLQVSVYGNVASDTDGRGKSGYSHEQSSGEVSSWVESTGGNVRFWGIGNEPFIAWKRSDYPSFFADAAHGDQVLNFHTSYEHYFNRFTTVAEAIKSSDSTARILGPTPANWWLYWFNDYSPICPVTEPGGDPATDDSSWDLMSSPESTWDKDIFPDRGSDPDVSGWESDPQKILPFYLKSMRLADESRGSRLAEFLDVHRYMRCITEKDAILEPMGLFHENFKSQDMETLFSGVKTNLLNRLKNSIERFYPETKISFSEYGYFYWDGYPSIPQVAAIGTMDYLGFFARCGVYLSCNWYLGEPNQSGADLTHASLDSARQAMFDEDGEPNPKYWAFYMMSNLFRGTSIKAEVSDWNSFSVHACENEKGDYVVFAVYKGQYDSTTGEYISDQPPEKALMRIDSSDGNLILTRLLRYGMGDPHVIEMDTTGISYDTDGNMIFDYHPLAIYAFVFSSQNSGDSLAENQSIQVTPDILDFGPYSNGWIVDGEKKIFTHGVKITNPGVTAIPWSMEICTEDCTALSFENSISGVSEASASLTKWLVPENSVTGEVSVTDEVYFTVDRAYLPVGTYTSNIKVSFLAGNAQHQKNIMVVMDVIPGEDDGEKRIADFETGSFAHSLNEIPPYSIGWWDNHGTPDDRNSPYLYNFQLNRNEVNRLGSKYCMEIEFNRKNGDTPDGRLYQSFGTYGHSTYISTDTSSGNQNISSKIKYNATGFWEGYEAFEFDIKTDTKGSDNTELLIILSDESGNKGKPSRPFLSEIKFLSETDSIKDYTDLLVVEDGPWQTVRIALDDRFFDWRYPEGQNGAETTMDFSSINQIEFVPWHGDKTAKGVIYIDNLRLVGPNANNNRLPVAAVEKRNLTVKPGQSVTLNGTPSFDCDPDDEITAWEWVSQNISIISDTFASETHISEPFASETLFSSNIEGTYIYDLVVTDTRSARSRNIAQVTILVSKDGVSIPDETDPDGDGETDVSIGGGSGGQGCFCNTLMTQGYETFEGNFFSGLSCGRIVPGLIILIFIGCIVMRLLSMTWEKG